MESRKYRQERYTSARHHRSRERLDHYSRRSRDVDTRRPRSRSRNRERAHYRRTGSDRRVCHSPRRRSRSRRVTPLHLDLQRISADTATAAAPVRQRITASAAPPIGGKRNRATTKQKGGTTGTPAETGQRTDTAIATPTKSATTRAHRISSSRS